jgi:hypothetical protein
MATDRKAEIASLSEEIAELQYQLSWLRHPLTKEDIEESQITEHLLNRLAGLSMFQVQATRGALIHDLRLMKVTWAEIADALGMTEQGAQKIHRAHLRLAKRGGRP